MQYVLAVYRSRSTAVRTHDFLSRQGQACALVSTPRQAGVGCGLSIKMSVGTYRAYAARLSAGESFVGFFVVRLTQGGQSVTKI